MTMGWTMTGEPVRGRSGLGCARVDCVRAVTSPCTCGRVINDLDSVAWDRARSDTGHTLMARSVLLS